MKKIRPTDRIETFENYCTCGGFAWQMNGRPESQPHLDWCGQREEYAEWYARQKRQVGSVTNGERT